jgi:hypothetical protein
MTPPTARIDMVYDTYFGTTVADPYRWLEDWEGAEARAWLDAQAACAGVPGCAARTSLLAGSRILPFRGGSPRALAVGGNETALAAGAHGICDTSALRSGKIGV